MATLYKLTVSIHAPRVGRDTRHHALTRTATCFNPRAPRGARRVEISLMLWIVLFQSTRPAWGATTSILILSTSLRCFNPRAPRGARPVRAACRWASQRFNPRAPRGARQGNWPVPCMLGAFQSTRPAWGATSRGLGRLPEDSQFQSTRPAWGATKAAREAQQVICVSIHAPRVGRDDV